MHFVGEGQSGGGRGEDGVLGILIDYIMPDMPCKGLSLHAQIATQKILTL